MDGDMSTDDDHEQKLAVIADALYAERVPPGGHGLSVEYQDAARERSWHEARIVLDALRAHVTPIDGELPAHLSDGLAWRCRLYGAFTGNEVIRRGLSITSRWRSADAPEADRMAAAAADVVITALQRWWDGQTPAPRVERATKREDADWTAGEVVRVQNAIERVLDEHNVGQDVNAAALYALALATMGETSTFLPAQPVVPVRDKTAGAFGQGHDGSEPPDFDAELGATWRERIESVIDEQIDAGIASGERRSAEDFARAIADEFGVADNQWVTMADPYTLPFPAHGATGTEISYAEVGDLPPGSWVLELNQNGAPAFGTATTPIVTTSYPMRRPSKAAADRLLVVARGLASEPVRAPAVGDSVRTAAELDALPVGAVVRYGRTFLIAWRHVNGWSTSREDAPAEVRDFLVDKIRRGAEFRVLDLPADQAPATDGGAS